MQLAPQTRRRHVIELAAHTLAADAAALGQPAFGQVHTMIAVGIPAGVLTPFGRPSQEVEFVRSVIEIISASPDRRTMSKKALVEMGVNTFGLSKRRAGALRDRVIDRLDAVAWLDPGRPRN